LYGNDVTYPSNCSSVTYVLSFTLSILCTHERHTDNVLLHRRCGPVLLNVADVIVLWVGIHGQRVGINPLLAEVHLNNI
jgi:hypothetical protein